jgi:DNA polymerase III sliding clamp (beta) subunit (PCNA family)
MTKKGLIILSLVIFIPWILSYQAFGSENKQSDVKLKLAGKKLPSLDILANSLKEEGTDVILSGNIIISSGQDFRIFTEKTIIKYNDKKEFISIEFPQKLIMEAKSLKVESERAFSEDFSHYLMFSGEVNIQMDYLDFKRSEFLYFFKK